MKLCVIFHAELCNKSYMCVSVCEFSELGSNLPQICSDGLLLQNGDSV